MAPIRRIFFTEIPEYKVITGGQYAGKSSVDYAGLRKISLYLISETSNCKVSFLRCDMELKYNNNTNEWIWVNDSNMNLVEFSDEPSGIWYRVDWYEDEYSDGKKYQRSVDTTIKITINRNDSFSPRDNSDVVELAHSLKRLEDKVDMLLSRMPITETKGGRTNV